MCIRDRHWVGTPLYNEIYTPLYDIQRYLQERVPLDIGKQGTQLSLFVTGAGGANFVCLSERERRRRGEAVTRPLLFTPGMNTDTGTGTIISREREKWKRKTMKTRLPHFL